jgi:hypothetical protein
LAAGRGTGAGKVGALLRDERLVWSACSGGFAVAAREFGLPLVRLRPH